MHKLRNLGHCVLLKLPSLLCLLCSQRWRETSAEKRELERLEFDMINEVRRQL